MRDDFLSRDWADNHAMMFDGIERLAHKLLGGFERLQLRRFDAPWKQPRRERCG